ncbi:MAG: carbohydrate-binding protein, partial [Bacteroidales bacterium]
MEKVAPHFRWDVSGHESSFPKNPYCLTWRLTDAIDPKMSFMSKAAWNDMSKTTSKDIYHDYSVKNYGIAAADAITEIINQNEPFASGFGECQETPAFKLAGTDDYLLNIKTFTLNGWEVDAVKPAQRNGTENAPCSEGGECVGFIKKGNWLQYNGLDFGSKTDSITMRVASASHGGLIEFRLDSPEGPVIGTCTVNDTQGWQSWINITVSIKPTGGVHALIFKFLEKPPISVLPEFEKAKVQLDIIDKYILTATREQSERLNYLRCRIAAAKDHIGMNNRFNDPQWKELPDVMQSWARNFTHRVTDISSLGNVMSSQNRFVQLNYLPKEQEVRKPVAIDAPLHLVVISAPASMFAGQPAPLMVRVLDSRNYESVSATLHWRQAGTQDWKSAPMARRVKAIFTLGIPAADLVEYYITVTEGTNSVRWPVTGNRSLITIGKAPANPQSRPTSIKADGQSINWTAAKGA